MPRMARFYKADLQMQTPVDGNHWRGPEKVNAQSTPEERQTVATAYVRRCYEIGLELIGITEHNLNPPACASLIPELQEAAKSLASEFGYQIVIFPGFEVATTIGGGLHVLCLFEPGTELEIVSEKLTSLGLPSDRRFTSGVPNPTPQEAGVNLNSLLRIVQEDENTPGLVIMAHAGSGSGLLDARTIAQWWSQAVIQDERVLCLELPHPRDHYISGPQNLIKSILQNVDDRYRRNHPIAAVMSSDCKAILESDHENNYIGFRHTWLKMGAPTIEGLRQAFLDHGSRVRFGDHRPEDGYTYPRIRSFSVDGAAFLEDQRLEFSPNLNVIIGGSGTGKSTIAQYLRMLFDQARVVRGADVSSNYERCLQTVHTSTKVSATVLLDGQEAEVAGIGRGPGVVTAPGSEMDGKDVSGVFPVRFFGQREIYNIAEDRAATVALLDDLERSKLSALDRKANELRTRYRESASASQLAPPLTAELAAVQADLAAKQIKVRRIEEEAAPFQALAAANDLRDVAAELLVDSSRAARDLLDSLEWPVNESSERDNDHLTAIRHAVSAAQQHLEAKIRDALDEFESTIRSTISGRHVLALDTEASRLRDETQPVLDDLASKGIDLQQYESYRSDVARLTDEASTIQKRIDAADEAERTRTEILAEIHLIWDEEVAVRTESAAKLNAAVPETKAGTPFVEASVEPFADDRAFRDRLDEYRGDRRKISDDDWAELVDSVTKSTTGPSPTQILVDWIRQLRKGEHPEGLDVHDERHAQRILDCFPDAALHELEVSRIPDRVRVLLRREDGSSAGDLEGGLSVGQKCTAVLALLLALDVTPVVIDQPEDDIDNEFTYSEVVPLLRKVKEQRQLIIVTHDPNIPVNADAEMIHALAAVDGRGGIKIVDGVEAVGSLDQQQVRVAVEEIMEGSENAFRRRFVKYGF